MSLLKDVALGEKEHTQCQHGCDHKHHSTHIAKKKKLREILATKISNAVNQALNENTSNSLAMTKDIRDLFNDEMIKKFSNAQTSAVGDLMTGGKVTKLMAEFAESLRKSLLQSFNRGVAGRGFILPPYKFGEAAILSPEFANFVESQVAYSNNFVRELGQGQLSRPGRMQVGKRVNLYANAFKGAFNHGAVVGGRPGEKIYWRLGACDHCADCPVLNLNSPYTRATLPTYPGAGGTICKSNCCCYLSFKPGMPDADGPPENQSDGWRERPSGPSAPNQDQLAHLRDLEQRKNAIRRRLANATDDDTRRALAGQRKALQRQIRTYSDGNGINWKPEFSVGEVITGNTLSPQAMDKLVFRGLDGSTLSKANVTEIQNLIMKTNADLIRAARDAGITSATSGGLTSKFGIRL